jgi:nucleoside-diphosphate-sugar epimerase
MAEYLISGNGSGLGKYLYDNLPKSLGFGRKDFNLVKREDFNTIIHCAFNKENSISDYYKYLEDNIFLTQELLGLKPKKFVYISTIDVYQLDPTMYALFKKFAESIVAKNKDALILRCSMMLGPTMKPNHITKIKNNESKIGLSGDSTFNYILMDDIREFIASGDYLQYSGIIDFMASDSIKLSKVKNYFNSNTELGNYTYETLDLVFPRYIHTLNDKYNKSSLENLKKYYE